MILNFLSPKILILYNNDVDCCCGAWVIRHSLITTEYKCKIEIKRLDQVGSDIITLVKGKTVILLNSRLSSLELADVVQSSHYTLLINNNQHDLGEGQFRLKLMFLYDWTRKIAQMCWELFLGGNYPWFIRHMIKERYSEQSGQILQRLSDRYNLTDIESYDLILAHHNLEYELVI